MPPPLANFEFTLVDRLLIATHFHETELYLHVESGADFVFGRVVLPLFHGCYFANPGATRIALRKVCTLVSVSALLCAAGTGGSPQDESAIRKVLAEDTAAFNEHRPNLIPEATSDDFDLVNLPGIYSSGKPDLRDAFRGAFRNAKMVATIDRIRFIRPDVALVDGTFEISGSDITPAPKGLRTFVLVKENGRWMITALRQMTPVASAGTTPLKN